MNGSSPHTWGIRRPAPGRDDLRPVHPHIRGAYRSRSVKSHSGFGSSPHTWGIRSILRIRPPTGRFIPTYVGHTPSGSAFSPACTVHPHIRGAYGFSLILRQAGHGSSPHTWGIPVAKEITVTYRRFIPTYVGHTLDRRKKNGWFQPLLL